MQREGQAFDNALDLWRCLGLDDALYGNGMEYANEEIERIVPRFMLKKETTDARSRPWAPSTLQLVTSLTRNNSTQELEDLPPIGSKRHVLCQEWLKQLDRTRSDRQSSCQLEAWL